MQHPSVRVCPLIVALLMFAVPIWTASAAVGQAQSAKPNTVMPVNLNTATLEQLDELPGVGPKMAALIVAYRQKNGGFKKVEDLMNVRGIGEKSFLKLRPLITVTPVKIERPGNGK